VIELNSEHFLDEIDKENKNVTILVHIYDHVCFNENEILSYSAAKFDIFKF
jgi:hypothetical protein